MPILQAVTAMIFALAAGILAAVFIIIAVKTARLLWHIGTAVFALIFIAFTADAIMLLTLGWGIIDLLP